MEKTKIEKELRGEINKWKIIAGLLLAYMVTDVVINLLG